MKEIRLGTIGSGAIVRSILDNVKLTGIGWIDNQLHIQIRMADGLDGYSEWIDSILYGRSGYDRQIPYTPLSWSVGNLYYEEYMYSYTPEDIDGLSLILSVNISKDRIDGPWVVRFPLSTIFPEVKEKTEESGTTWQDFGEVKEPEATEQVTDEVVELENSPYYVPFDETAPAEENPMQPAQGICQSLSSSSPTWRYRPST